MRIVNEDGEACIILHGLQAAGDGGEIFESSDARVGGNSEGDACGECCQGVGHIVLTDQREEEAVLPSRRQDLKLSAVHGGLKVHAANPGACSQSVGPGLAVGGRHGLVDRVIRIDDGDAVGCHEASKELRLRIAVLVQVGVEVEVVSAEIREDRDTERNGVCSMHRDAD